MKVKCVRLFDSMGKPTDRSPWTKVGEIYDVLSIVVDTGRTRLRLVGEERTPALFEFEMFEIVSSRIPDTWVVVSPQVGSLSIGPKAWARAGYWEAFFDADPEAVACFEEEQRKILAAESSQAGMPV